MSELGDVYERSAEQYLCARGLQMVDRQVRFRFGEIDLVMREGPTLVFIEVRYRRASAFADAATSVDHHKRKRLRLAAHAYLQQRVANPTPCRFDVMAGGGSPRAPQWSWIPNAFS